MDSVMDNEHDVLLDGDAKTSDEVLKFADSYESFSRIVNSLQRQYIELKDEFTQQNDQLFETNRQLAEMTERNLAANEFLNSILDSMSAGVIAIDRDGRITQFNSAASLMLGIPVREPLGQLYREIIPPGDPIDANALRSSETGKAVDCTEKKIDLPDGTRLIVSTSTAILKDRSGKPAGAVEVLHDLTKTKKMEREIARLNTLAALGEMAATVAHQVRNPLSGILGYGSLLKRELEADDPRQKLISKITEGVEVLNATVTTLLDYTRNEELNCEYVAFGEYISDAIAQFRRENPDLTRQMELRVEPAASPGNVPVMVLIDPVLFRQVLFNLLTNSCEACRMEGTVNVAFRKVPRQRAVEQYAKRLLIGLDETVLELRISDDGCGISQEVLSSLFSPFFTTKHGGNGLGLAVAQKIAKAHGGDLGVDQSTTGGATFTLLLPVRMGQTNRET